MKIQFISCARYPTEKAYGVTIGNTLNSLTELGVANSVLTWGKSYPDEYNNKLVSIARYPFRVPLEIYSLPLRALSRLSYVLNQFIYSLYLIFNKDVFSKESVLWTREPITLLMHSIFSLRSSYLIELHHSVGTFSRFIIKFLSIKNNVQIIALSDDAVNDFSLKFKGISVTNLPMGVPKSFSEATKEKSSGHFSVGYLGKGVSNGNDNELSEIVYVSKLMQDHGDIQFIFLGLEQVYKNKLKVIISDLNVDASRITFIDHVEHKRVAEELIKFDVGILPYPESVYNSERFPLKLLEYAAVGLPVIASDTTAHRKLLDETFALFYKKGNPTQLSDAILKIKNESGLYTEMSANARQFSLSYTYDERARKLINMLIPASQIPAKRER
jgi:glycosyltransferase involved in cell wall biosynthesis